MNGGIRAAEIYLRDQYRRLYASPEWQFTTTVSSPIAQPTWRQQSSDLRDSSDQQLSEAALLLDPELGVCLYLLGFKESTKVKNQIARAIAIQSRLLQRQSQPSPSQDQFGSWRVVLHWLVKQEDFERWVEQVANLREQTGHFEEIAVDAVIAPNGDWDRAVERHSFPRLMFQTRSIFSKLRRETVESWESADTVVSARLANFHSEFTDALTVQCAQRVEKIVKSRSTNNAHSTTPEMPRVELESLSIFDFRNITSLKIDFRSQSEAVASTVIHGPNGSGKSSLYEALSLAVARTSTRHLNYVADPTRQIFGRGDRYVDDYLSGFGAEAPAIPRVGLNSKKPTPVELVSGDEAKARMAELCGTFFSQDMSQSLLEMRADELGAEIAASFSTLADAATTFVEDNYSSALETLHKFNDKWGLRANVTRQETATAQIAEKLIRRHIPNLQGLIAWLNVHHLPESQLSPTFQSLSERLTAWDNEVEKASTLAARDAFTTGSPGRLLEFLRRGRELLNETAAALSKLKAQISACPSDVLDRIDRLATRLQVADAAEPSAANPGEIDAALERERSLAVELRGSAEDGRLVAERLESLDKMAEFLSHWSPQHDDFCPICKSDVAARGGILAITRSLVSELRNELESKRASYQKLQREHREAALSLTELGVSGGASAEDLAADLGWLIADHSQLLKLIRESNKRDQLKQTLTHYRSVPNVNPLPSDLEQLCSEVTEEIRQAATEHEAATKMPEIWKTIRQHLLAALSQITSTHLPQTLEALWTELAWNMTPAPWQYPGRIGFRTGVRRLSPEVAVMVSNETKSVLAGHILNSAEVHNLGLAWFFTRFLSVGRFRFGFLVLDDPCSSMDQPTFRDFCRLLETFLRLHRKEKRPLSLVLLLHQDSRAIDAARSTDAQLHTLRWNRNTPVILRRLRLHTRDSAAPEPTIILEAG